MMHSTMYIHNNFLPLPQPEAEVCRTSRSTVVYTVSDKLSLCARACVSVSWALSGFAHDTRAVLAHAAASARRLSSPSVPAHPSPV